MHIRIQPDKVLTPRGEGNNLDNHHSLSPCLEKSVRHRDLQKDTLGLPMFLCMNG
jgi:hypothetical protein